ncbi:MAG: aspartate carbamoyltransferase [Oscillospiraceae bacterium]|nr:aspartate carbamoyltransferase [Oscillospiraceae bacterium]
MKNFNHLIDLNDFGKPQWDEIISLGEKIMDNPHIYEASCRGKIMGTLFYEPSTRTQMSFQSAMLRLGGGIIGFDNPTASSVMKGESLKDTTKIVSSYSDIMVMRHPVAGSVKAAALTADCPIINAGDGGHLHPTQTLTDMLTLHKEKGRLTGLRIGICGDLKYGRTVHSLVKALSCYEGNSFVFISADELQMPDYITAPLEKWSKSDSIDEAIGGLDVLYMTRIQKERFPSGEEYERQASRYILDPGKLKKAGEDLIVLHPLPRLHEIDAAVDSDPRALYFKQAHYGMYVRMALILIMLNYDITPPVLLKGETHGGAKCKNDNCILQNEPHLPQSFIKNDGVITCEYCESRFAL